jgi:glycosyltransferase involved in cell wall biosynthesis
MKIVLLSDDFPPHSYGGAGIVALNLAKGLFERGYEVFVITTSSDKHKVGVSDKNGIKVYTLYSSYDIRFRNYISIYNPFLSAKVDKILSELRPDIVHAHNLHQNLSYNSLKIAKKYADKVVLTLHDSNTVAVDKVYPINGSTNYKISWIQELKISRLRFNPFRRVLVKYYLKYVDQIVSVSDSLKDLLITNGIKNIVTINNGIDANEWSLKEFNGTSSDFEKLNNKKVIMFSGRLSGGKGVYQILNAFELVLKKVPDAYLLVLGKRGEQAEKMLDLADVSGIKDSIGFTGWITGDSIKQAYQISKVVVVPSVYLDPFPTVNLEALSMSRPVVGTCYGGTKEIVVDGESGYIVNPVDLDELSDRIVALLLDDELRLNMGTRGRDMVLNSHTLSSQVDKTISVYLK